jgi:hypothetical protein
LLEICRQSVRVQCDEDWEQVVIEDQVGIGVAGMYREVRRHVDQVHGDYVYMLQDDDMLVDPRFVAQLRKFVEATKWPEVVIVKIRAQTRELPLIWREAPRLGRIDLGNFVVRADVWKAHAADFGQRYEGDFDFIMNLWDCGYRFEWWPRVVAKKVCVGRGRAEVEIAGLEALAR